MGHPQSKRPSAAAWFALGFLATICQILLLREFLVLCSGSELGIALLLSAWLAGITAGALIGYPLQRWTVSHHLLPHCLTILALSCPASLAAVRLAGLPADLPAGALLPLGRLAVIAMIAVLPPGLLVGITFPLACTAESDGARQQPRRRGIVSIGRVYALEAAGSFSAGMLHTWVLVTRLPAMQTALLSGALLSFSAACFIRQPKGSTKRQFPRTAARGSSTAAGLLLLIAGLTPMLGGRLDQHTLEQRWARLHSGIRFVETMETPYQRLSVGRLEDQWVITANGSVITAYPDPYAATLTGHFILSVHPAPKRVLLVGGVASGLLTAMLRHPDIIEIRCLELDPALPALHHRLAGDQDRLSLADPRFTLQTGDGRRWINRTARSPAGSSGTWDLIVVLLPDPTTAMINRYYTREFYAGCRALLSPDGALLCRVTASANYLEGETGALARSVFATLRHSFATVRAGGGDRLFFAAANQPPPDFFSSASLVRNYQASGALDPGFSPLVFHTMLEEERAGFLERKLRQDQAMEMGAMNSDWRPLAQIHTLRLWSRFAGDSMEHLFRQLFRPLPSWLFIGALCLLGIWSLLPLISRRRTARPARARRSVLAAVAVAGFAGLGLELLCLHVYQGAFGTVYRMIGSVVALFMLGLALGGGAATPLHRRLSPHQDRGLPLVLALGLAGQTLVALGAPAALHLAIGGSPLASAPGLPEALVLLLVGAAGWFTGLALPAAGGILDSDNPLDAGRGTGRASALVNSADHLGAASAAALVGLVAIPRLGVLNSAGFMALLTGGCAVRIWLESRGWKR